MSLKTLDEIFDKKIFRIPDYQRGYCWSEDELNALWTDLQRLRDDAFHFTGTIVLQNLLREGRHDDIDKWVEEIDIDYFRYNENYDKWQIEFKNNDTHYSPYYVVDGQQRLTSMIILLKCVGDRFKEFGNEVLSREIDNYFICIKNGGNKIFYWGYEKDIPCHEWLINKIYVHTDYSLTEKESFYTHKLDSAKTYFETKLQNIEYEKDLVDLMIKIRSKLKFNVYELDKTLNVSMVFETLNNRGKTLSTLEKLKNRLIYLVDQIHPHESIVLRNEIVKTWQEIYQNLGKYNSLLLDDDEFLRAHWIVYFSEIYIENFNNAQLKKSTQFLLDKYFVFDNRENLSTNRIRRYLNSISEASRFWLKIKFPQKENLNFDDIEYWQLKINTFHRVGGNYFEPLILASYLLDMNNEYILLLLKAIERHNFIAFRLCNYKSNFNREHYCRKASELYNKGIGFFTNIIEDLSLKTREAYSEERLNENINSNPQNLLGFKSWEGLKYLLIEYEIEASNQPLTNLSYDIQAIFPDPENQVKAGWTDCARNYGTVNVNKLHRSLGNFILRGRSYNTPFQNFNLFIQSIDLANARGRASISEMKFRDDFTTFSDRKILERGIEITSFIERRWNVVIRNKQRLLLPDFTFRQ